MMFTCDCYRVYCRKKKQTKRYIAIYIYKYIIYDALRVNSNVLCCADSFENNMKCWSPDSKHTVYLKPMMPWGSNCIQINGQYIF